MQTSIQSPDISSPRKYADLRVWVKIDVNRIEGQITMLRLDERGLSWTISLHTVSRDLFELLCTDERGGLRALVELNDLACKACVKALQF